MHVVAEVPAVPVIGEFAWLVIGVGALAAWVVLLGLRGGYDYSLGKLLRMLADVLDFKVWRFHVNLGAGLDRIDHAIQQTLASGILATEKVIGKWWWAQEKLAQWTYDSLAYFANSTVAAFDSLVHGTIPTAVGNATGALAQGLGKVGRRMVALERNLETQLVRRTRALEAEVERDFGRAWRGIDNLRGKAIPRVLAEVAALGAAIAALRKFAHGTLNKRITRLEKLVLGGAFTAGVLAVLTRYFPYWRCSNVRRFNRNLCRSPIGSLDWLFGLAGASVLVLDPDEVIKVGTEVEHLMADAFRTMAKL